MPSNAKPATTDQRLSAVQDPIRCRAHLARETPSHVGVAFSEFSDDDFMTLGRLVEDAHARETATGRPARV